jgi:hypothetical protein
MILLNALHCELLVLERAHGFDGRFGGGEVGGVGDFLGDGGGADEHFVGAGFVRGRGVDHEVDFPR